MTPDAGSTELRCAEQTCELTCEVLNDPRFCWTLGLEEAYACTNGAATGTISNDGLTCFAPIDESNELVITFENPLVEGEVIGLDDWSFEIARNGEECLSFDDTPENFVLATSRGTTTVAFEEQGFLRVTCPTGDVWETTDLEGILACRNEDQVTALPGRSTTKIGREFGISLLPRSSNLFTCSFGDSL